MEKQNNNNDKAIVPLLLGVVSLIAWIIPIAGFVVSIIGMVLSTKSIKQKKPLSKIALIFNGIGLMIASVIIVYIVIITINDPEQLKRMMK